MNLYYVVTLVPLVQAKVVKQGFGWWLRENFLPFVLIGIGAFGGAKLFAMTIQSSVGSWLTLGCGVLIYVAAIWFVLSESLRDDLLGTLKQGGSK